MTDVYKYSVIRFRPFAEIGEFANIGVLVARHRDGVMAYKLAPIRFPRLRQFFDDRAYDAYGEVRRAIDVELARTTVDLPTFAGKHGLELFADFVSKRESSVLFSEPRFLEFDGNPEQAAGKLYDRFIKREAVVQSREEVWTRSIRTELHRHGIKVFKQLRLHDDLVPISFPLAYDGPELRAIRPLAFAQKTALNVIDHAAHWETRLRLLLDRKRIKEGNILIPVEPPREADDDTVEEAFDLAFSNLKRLPFEVIVAADPQHIDPAVVEFAERSVPSLGRFLQ